MRQSLTKDHLDGAVSTIRRDIRDLVKHFNDSQSSQNEQLTEITHLLTDAHVKLNAIMSLDVIATRKQLLNLIRALKEKRVVLNEAKILTA